MPEKILAVTVENEPHIVPEVGRALGDADVNITALSFAPVRDSLKVLLMTDNADQAFEALRNDGFMVERVTGLVLDLQNRPGEFARIAEDLVDAGVEVTCGLVTREGYLVVGVDDYDKAVDAAGGTAVAAHAETGGASGPPAS